MNTREDFMLNMILRFLVRREGRRKDKKGRKGKGGREDSLPFIFKVIEQLNFPSNYLDGATGTRR